MPHSRQDNIDANLGSSFLTDDAGIEGLFGTAARFYVPLFRQLIPRVFQVDYKFEDPVSFERKLRDGVYDPKQTNRIVWLEILFRAQMVVSGSLYRNCRLIDASVREHRASNLPGWASCVRALLESAGDSSEALRAVPGTLAEHHRFIRRCLSGQESRPSGSKELEDRLIHFTHGRRLGSAEKGRVPPSHKAKLTRDYIAELQAHRLPGVPSLYSELCEHSHPAASSVEYCFSAVNGGPAFRIDPRQDRLRIDAILDRHRLVFHDPLMICFNPVLLSLRVIQAFRLFPELPQLYDVDLTPIPAWTTIKRHLGEDDRPCGAAPSA